MHPTVACADFGHFLTTEPSSLCAKGEQTRTTLLTSEVGSSMIEPLPMGFRPPQTRETLTLFTLMMTPVEAHPLLISSMAMA